MRILNYCCLAIAVSLFFISNVFCEPDYSYYKKYGSQAEISRLPEYCRGRLSKNAKDKSLYYKWKKIVGGDFIHFHHYCYGLLLTQRSFLESRLNYREAMIQLAIRNLKYVNQNASSKLDIRWRIIMQKNLCKALVTWGKYEQANIETEKLNTLLLQHKKKKP